MQFYACAKGVFGNFVEPKYMLVVDSNGYSYIYNIHICIMYVYCKMYVDIRYKICLWVSYFRKKNPQKSNPAVALTLVRGRVF